MTELKTNHHITKKSNNNNNNNNNNNIEPISNIDELVKIHMNERDLVLDQSFPNNSNSNNNSLSIYNETSLLDVDEFVSSKKVTFHDDKSVFQQQILVLQETFQKQILVLQETFQKQILVLQEQLPK